jgi:Mo-co oxidoreductase dimerisation domain
VWTFATVKHDRLKSAPARVTRRGDEYKIRGVAWGAPIERVEMRVDNGPWLRARLLRARSGGPGRAGYSWVFWSIPWDDPASGEHTVTTRAWDRKGNVQRAPTDPFYAAKRTYWESNAWITRRVRIP